MKKGALLFGVSLVIIGVGTKFKFHPIQLSTPVSPNTGGSMLTMTISAPLAIAFTFFLLLVLALIWSIFEKKRYRE